MVDDVRSPGIPVEDPAKLRSGGLQSTSIPVPADHAGLWSFVVVTGVALVVYGFTLPPEVMLEWSGVRSTSAMYGGVADPPGFPLWTIYAWLFTKLVPFSNIAWRVAVSSAVAAALASGVVAWTVSRGGRILYDGTPSFTRLEDRARSWLCGASGCVAGLAFGFSAAVWSKAVTASCWALSFLLFAILVALLTRWTIEPKKRRSLCAAFFIFGLLLTANQELIIATAGLAGAIMLRDRKLGRDVSLFVLPLVAAMAGVFDYGVWIQFLKEPNWPVFLAFIAAGLVGLTVAGKLHSVGSEWKSALLCAACFLSGAAFCFYLPIASMTNPPVNWAYPRVPEGFFHLISRGQYQHSAPVSELSRFVSQLWTYLKATGQDLGGIYLVLALMPFFNLRRMAGTGRILMLSLVPIWVCVGPLLVAMLNFPPLGPVWWQLFASYFVASQIELAVWAGFGLTLLGAMMTGWLARR